MSVMYLILPLALLVVFVAVLGFVWAARRGQFDDLDTPAMRALHDEVGKKKPIEVVWHEEAPEGKLDLLVTLDFRMSTTCMYSDIVLPTATWYEKNDFNTSDMHPFIHPLTSAVDPVWGCKSDWEIYKAIAKKFSEVAPEVLGVEKDVVMTPIMHDTPGEIAQALDVKDWKKGEVEPIPGKTMPAVAVVERDYPNVYKRFTSLGPLMEKLGNGVKLGYYVKLGDYVKLGNNVRLGDYVKLGNDVQLGNDVKLGNNVRLGDHVTSEGLNEEFRDILRKQFGETFIAWKWVTKDRQSPNFDGGTKLTYPVGTICETVGVVSDQQCGPGLHVLRMGYRPEWVGLCPADHDLICLHVRVRVEDVLFAGLPTMDAKLRVRRLEVLD